MNGTNPLTRHKKWLAVFFLALFAATVAVESTAEAGWRRRAYRRAYYRSPALVVAPRYHRVHYGPRYYHGGVRVSTPWVGVGVGF